MMLPVHNGDCLGHEICARVWSVGMAYKSNSNVRGSSTVCFIFLRKRTASLPSISRWSYVSATYIIGLTSTCREGGGGGGGGVSGVSVRDGE